MEITEEMKVRQLAARFVARRMSEVDALGDDAPRDAQGRQLIVHALISDTIHETLEFIERAGHARVSVAILETVNDENRNHAFRVHVLTVAGNDKHDVSPCNVGTECAWGDLLKMLMPGSEITVTTKGRELRFGDATVSEVVEPALA